MNSIKYTTEFCTACGLCHSVNNIRFNNDNKGFPTPLLKNIDGYYDNVCPVNYYSRDKVDFKLWGEYKEVYAGYSNDSEIRHRASSGGALTELSIYLLENGIVDGIIHTGVSHSSPIETQTVCSTTKEEVISHCGSRYSISAPFINLKKIVQKNKKYAFVGKPCDVAALIRYIGIDTVLKEQIVLTMSFFCAGMPSMNANKALLEKMGCNLENCKEIKYRGDGWPGYTTAEDKQGKKHQIEYSIAWGDYLGRDVKKICRYCMDGIGELADIVCADLWYLKENYKPDFSEHEGRNIIFCRTELGKEVLQATVKNGNLTVEDYSVEMDHFHCVQPYQFERRTTMKYRLLALRLFGRFVPKYNKKLLNDANAYALPGMNRHIFIGTVKRILKGKL